MARELNRRSFVKLLGAIAASPGLAGPDARAASHAADSGIWKMRLSTSSIHFKELPIEQACARIARLGFEAVDIWSAHDDCPHLDDVADRLGPDGLRALLAKHKLKLFSFSVYRGGYARYAKLLGEAGGGVAVQGSAAPCKPAELTMRMRQFIAGLKPLADLAEKHNAYLAIENHGDALLNTLDSLKAFVDTNRSPRVGIALAPYHIQGLKASVPEAIRICGRQLLFFYAWQHGNGTQQLPGIGPAEMKPWIEALVQVRYPGYVNPFMHGHLEPDVMATNLATARDYLKDCHAQLQTTKAGILK